MGGYAGRFGEEFCLGGRCPLLPPPPRSGPDTCLQKNCLRQMNDQQITVFIAIKRRPNFSIINYGTRLISAAHLKPNQFIKFRKSIKVANYLTLNEDMIEVLVLAKSQKPGFSPNIIIC